MSDYDTALDTLLRVDILDAARAEELRAAIAPLRDRLAEVEARRQSTRERLAELLDAHGVVGEARPFGRMTLVRTPPRVDVHDAEALASQFIRINPEPDKAAIRAALAAGEEVPGARLSNGSVTVRIST